MLIIHYRHRKQRALCVCDALERARVQVSAIIWIRVSTHLFIVRIIVPTCIRTLEAAVNHYGMPSSFLCQQLFAAVLVPLASKYTAHVVPRRNACESPHARHTHTFCAQASNILYTRMNYTRRTRREYIERTQRRRPTRLIDEYCSTCSHSVSLVHFFARCRVGGNRKAQGHTCSTRQVGSQARACATECEHTRLTLEFMQSTTTNRHYHHHLPGNPSTQQWAVTVFYLLVSFPYAHAHGGAENKSIPPTRFRSSLSCRCVAAAAAAGQQLGVRQRKEQLISMTNIEAGRARKIWVTRHPSRSPTRRYLL